MEATLDKFGRIVIPKKIRDAFDLRPGSAVRIEEKKEEILLKPIENESRLIEKEGVLVFTGRAIKNIETEVEKLRKDRDQARRKSLTIF